MKNGQAADKDRAAASPPSLFASVFLPAADRRVIDKKPRPSFLFHVLSKTFPSGSQLPAEAFAAGLRVPVCVLL